MTGGDIVVISGELMIHLLIILLYAVALSLAFRLLFARLAPAAKRLAFGMLAAQILVIIAALAIEPSSAFEKWLWDFESEWNIPATLASTQLAAVGGVLLLMVWPAPAPSQRLYCLGIGLLFVFLALDEYFLLHERIHNWTRVYAALGAAVVGATLLYTARAPRPEWLARLSLLPGLAVAAAGAMIFNFLPETCVKLDFVRLSGCLDFLFLGEALELIGVWLSLAAALGMFSAVTRTGKRRVQLALYALPLLWIALLIYDPILLRLELKFLATPTAIALESDTSIHGFRRERQARDITFQLYASTPQGAYIGLGYSIHLIDQVTGESIASSDKHAGSQLSFKLDSDFTHIYRQRMRLELPADAPRNRALWAVLTLWRKDGDAFQRQAIRQSDRRQLSDTQVVLDELVLPAEPPAAITNPIARFANGFSLEAAVMPQRLQPGATMEVAFSWRAESEINEDYTQFLHFIHERSGEQIVFDQEPLGARLPTRLWHKGLADSETWALPLPADLAPGRYQAFTGLYRSRDLERAAASSAQGTPLLNAQVPLGSLMVE